MILYLTPLPQPFFLIPLPPLYNKTVPCLTFPPSLPAALPLLFQSVILYLLAFPCSTLPVLSAPHRGVAGLDSGRGLGVVLMVSLVRLWAFRPNRISSPCAGPAQEAACPPPLPALLPAGQAPQIIGLFVFFDQPPSGPGRVAGAR